MATKPRIESLTNSLSQRGIGIVGVSGVSEMPDVLRANKFDAALIDLAGQGAEVAYRRIKKYSRIPVARTGAPWFEAWTGADWPDFDAYIPYWAGGDELAWRLRAIVRRWELKS